MKSRTLIVLSSNFINLLLNSASQMSIARNLRIEDYAYYLSVMATVPILAVVAIAFQQTSAMNDIDERKANWAQLLKLIFLKCLPYSIICLILGGIILIKAKDLWAILIFMVLILNFTVIFAGIVGMAQRKMELMKWLFLSVLDSVSRLLVLLVLLRFNASVLIIIFGLVASSFLTIIICVLLFSKQKISLTNKMEKFSYKQIQINIFFYLFLQSDILILQGMSWSDQNEDYVILSTLVKILAGIGILFGQMILINSKKIDLIETKFWQLAEYKYYLAIWVGGFFILVLFLSNLNIIESILLIILNQQVEFDIKNSLSIFIAQMFIVKSFFFVIVNLEKNNYSSYIFLLSSTLFYLLSYRMQNITDLSTIFMIISILNFVFCKIIYKIISR